MIYTGRKTFLCSVLVLLFVAIVLTIWREQAEDNAYIAPAYEQIDLSSYLAQQTPDYSVLLYQTGLGKQAVDALWNTPEGKAQIVRVQSDFFQKPEIQCKPNSLISREERTKIQVTQLVDLQKGDILLTPCSHTFGWRNGHAALVIDAQKGSTLESVVLGQPSSVQNVEKWVHYPQFVVLRLRGASAQARARTADWAMQYLQSVPYHFTVGVLSSKQPQWDNITGTQCAHLVWLAYAAFGYDIDANAGRIVTPHDILGSHALEVVQAYGMDMAQFDV